MHDHGMTTAIEPALVIYDRAAVLELLRCASADDLAAAAQQAQLAAQLPPAELAELNGLLAEWQQRALGPMALRDALIVDPQRGRRVYGLLCSAFSSGRSSVAAEQALHLPAAPCDLTTLPREVADDRQLREFAAQAAARRHVLAWQARRHEFAPPGNLADLPLDPPHALPAGNLRFEQPTGARLLIGIGLALLGMLLFLGPLITSGVVPAHPAGLPLALITAALLVGIRAGLRGYLGAALIWLVANLPGFRHDRDLIGLWPAVPLMISGLLLLRSDPHVRAMWQHIARQFTRD
jgi:hypothetical protein